MNLLQTSKEIIQYDPRFLNLFTIIIVTLNEQLVKHD